MTITEEDRISVKRLWGDCIKLAQGHDAKRYLDAALAHAQREARRLDQVEIAHRAKVHVIRLFLQDEVMNPVSWHHAAVTDDSARGAWAARHLVREGLRGNHATHNGLNDWRALHLRAARTLKDD